MTRPNGHSGRMLMLASEEWQQAKELFGAAIECDAADRRALLDSRCGPADAAVRGQVEALLNAHDRADGFLDTPAVILGALALPRLFAAGHTIGRYRVQSLLGAGGMGEVYLAEDPRLGRKVALKLLPQKLAADTDRLKRFEQEARTASALSHPNVCVIYEIGDTEASDDASESRRFIAMEYVPGESLRTLLERHSAAGTRVPLAEGVSIAQQIARALAASHEAGVVHRDIKPENVMIRPDGLVKVLDFGLAKLTERVTTGSSPAEDDERSVHTMPGTVLGTVQYMSPEQTRGLPADSRTDTWSLGAVLYELLAGRPAFAGETSSDVMVAVLERDPPALSAVAPSTPAALQCIVERALIRDREHRYRGGAEMGRELSKFQSQLARDQESIPTMRNAEPPTEPVPRVARAHGIRDLPRLPALLTLGAAISIAAAWLINRNGRDAADQPPGAAATASGLLPGGAERRQVLDPRRVAVLYFDDHSADRGLGYLAAGLTESLIHELSAVPAIQVVSRNGVKPYRDGAVSMDSIVRALRVGNVVEGSVQRSGNRIRVSAQVIDARSNAPLESSTMERDLEDLFKLEDDLAREVASMLRRRIGREIRVRETIAATSSSRARELVFRADAARESAELALAGTDTIQLARGFASLRAADSLLAAAEKADTKWVEPVIARGWVALDAGLRQGGAERDGSFRRASEHAGRAMSHNPREAGAFELRGTILHYKAARLPLSDAEADRNLRRAAADLRQALAADPALATAWGMLGRVELMQGNLDEAVRSATTALKADSYLKDAPDVLVTLYAATVMRDSLDASWKWCLRGSHEFPRDPRFVECQLTLLVADARRKPDTKRAWSLVARGNLLDPPREARGRGRPWLPFYRMMLAASVSARAGDRDSARAVAARVRSAVSNDPELTLDAMYQDAHISLLLGDRKDAIMKLARYHASRPSESPLTLQHARWKPLRNDTAFVNILLRAKESR